MQYNCQQIVNFRICNEDMAVLIVSLVQIMKDVRWFIVVLAITLISFAQAFLALLSGTSFNAPCSGENITNAETRLREALESDPENFDLANFLQNQLNQFENCEAQRNYERSYEMMIGDWDVDIFRQSDNYIVFVLFTFFVSLIMLNILIAIASDSYATAKLEGPVIYRLERIYVTAELSAIEGMHMSLLSQNIKLLIAKGLSLGLLVGIIVYSKFESITTLPSDFHDEALVTFIITMVCMVTVILFSLLLLFCMATGFISPVDLEFYEYSFVQKLIHDFLFNVAIFFNCISMYIFENVSKQNEGDIVQSDLSEELNALKESIFTLEKKIGKLGKD